jgi:hypothetical protein
MKILEHLLIDKYVRMEVTRTGDVEPKIYVGTITKFHQHIDGGIIIDGYCITNNRRTEGIICKLCIKSLGTANGNTNVLILEEYIKLETVNNTEFNILKEEVIIYLLDELN